MTAATVTAVVHEVDDGQASKRVVLTMDGEHDNAIELRVFSASQQIAALDLDAYELLRAVQALVIAQP